MKKNITLLVLVSALVTSPFSFAEPDSSATDATASTVAAASQNLNSVNGVVLSVTGNTLVMQSTATNGFRPESSILAVNLADLGLTETPRMGTVIEVSGQWDGNLFQAAQLSNTPPAQETYYHSKRSDDDNDERHEYREHQAKNNAQKLEVEGHIVSVDGNMISVQARKFEYARPDSDTISIDVSQARFEDGRREHLAVNRSVEIKGAWDGSTLYATKVEFE